MIKLSSPETKDFWEIPVLYEDEHLFVLNKPPLLFTSPDREDPQRPNLTTLLHRAIEHGTQWARERGLSYLMPVHRLDAETSGAILLAKSKPMLIALANLFGSEKPNRIFVALVQGTPAENAFQVEVKLAPHSARPGLMQVDPRNGKRSRTVFAVRERFDGCTLIECRLLTNRPHQIRAHLRYAGYPIAGDELYGGRPLLLSSLKSDYRLKEGKTERPLTPTAALHAERLALPHPVTGAEIDATAPWPKDLSVAVKYLRRYAIRS